MTALNLSLERTLEVLDEPVVEGEGPRQIRGLASLDRAGAEDLSFLGGRKYRQQVAMSQAGWILVPRDFEGGPGPGQGFLRVDNPSLGLAQVAALIEPLLFPLPAAGIAPTAVVDPRACVSSSAVIEAGAVVGAEAQVDDRAWIGPGCCLGRGARVGEDTRLRPHVVLFDHCAIGKRCRLGAGVVVGSGGFGYESDAGGHTRIPHLGKVVIEDDVDIGANSTIDRARLDETRIGRGTRIDNLVQIGHNVKIGEHCLIVAQTGISGSTRLGNGVVVGGQVGLAGHLEIGDGVMIGAQAGISKSLQPGEKVRGTPHLPIPLFQKLFVLNKRLPDLFERVRQLEEVLEVRNLRNPTQGE